jgi:hypothetical protein
MIEQWNILDKDISGENMTTNKESDNLQKRLINRLKRMGKDLKHKH